MWNPEIMDSQIADWDNVVFGSVYLGFVHCEANHGYSLACRERVVEGVAELGAAYGDYDFRKLVQYVLNAVQVADVEGLEPSD